MRPRLRRTLARAAAFLAGAALGFFLVLGPVFADGPRSLAHPERLASFGLTLGGFLLAGGLLGLASPRDRFLAVLLALPGLLLAGLYVTDEPGVAGLAAAYVALAAAGAMGGAALAGRVRRAPPTG